jgi:hypothetical protein
MWVRVAGNTYCQRHSRDAFGYFRASARDIDPAATTPQIPGVGYTRFF